MRRSIPVAVVLGFGVVAVMGWPFAPPGPAAGADAPLALAPIPDARPLALVGGLIRTQTDAGDFVSTIVIQNGKVVALGRDVTVPADARRLDVAGHVITPGLIDAHGTLGLNAAASRESGRDAGLNVLDAVDPYAEDWRDAAAQGITAVYAQPAGSGLLGGSGAVLRVGPSSNAEDLAVKSPAGV